MREIKFRAWDKKLNKIRQISMLETDRGLPITFQSQYYSDGGEHTCRLDIELMQSTGLKDKNGKDIYEGDVVDCISGEVDNHVGVVKFDDISGFYIRTDKDSFIFSDFWDINGVNIEVIGNIYENPDLIIK